MSLLFFKLNMGNICLIYPIIFLFSFLKASHLCILRIHSNKDFPGGAVVKNPPANSGAQVRPLVQEEPTCGGATKPACHNY